MPGKNIEFGRYGAKGIKGHEAIWRQLDRLVDYIKSPITSPRGLAARLRYLTGSKSARQAAREAGLTVTDRTIKAWQRGQRKPSPASIAQIEQAYRTVRRHNVTRDLIRRLDRGGRGTRIEIHPLNQSQVDRPRQRHIPYRDINVRNWAPVVQHWADGDDAAAEAEWDDTIQDLGSQWGEYEYVGNVGFSA